MGLHLKVIGAVTLGVGAYALYKTGLFKPVAKKAVQAGMNVRSWAKEKTECVKEKYASLKEEAAKEQAEIAQDANG